MSMRSLTPLGWLMIVLGGLMIVGGVAGGVAVSEARAGLLGGGVLGGLGVAGGGWFMIWIARGWDEPAETAQDIYTYGRPANAQVLEAGEVVRSNGIPTAKLKLRVAPINEDEFTTRQTVAIPGGHRLAAGDLVTIKFDPNDRKSFVVLEDNFAVRDQFGKVSRFAPGVGAAV